MCGIGGFTLMPPGPIKSEWLRTFLQDLAHRGPDDSGWVSWNRGTCRQGREVEQDLMGEALLMHRRLSILDLSEGGHQPMGTPDERYWITFNGEIYNYVELREELKALGHTFRTHSDTEVLLTAFTQWGAQSFTRLVGMFAFVILDVQTRRLIFVRDFFGIKPLYYAFWQEGIAFASEIKPLLELPGVRREVNPQRLYDYLSSGMTDYGVDTLFANVKQLPAAHYMELSLDDPKAINAVRYWDVDVNQGADVSFEDAALHLRELFLESVRLHLRSDVPVGAALSGGIDSSSIVSAMRSFDPKLDIHAFSYVAEDPRLSEERWIDLVGREAQVKIHKVYFNPGDLIANLDSLIEFQGEPFVSTSVYAQRRVFQCAREAGIKVMLDGQGADELLGGYPGYKIAAISSLLSQGRWLKAMKLWGHASSRPTDTLRRVMPGVLSFCLPRKFKILLRKLFRKDTVPAWLNASWFYDHHIQGQGTDLNYAGKKEVLKYMQYNSLTHTSLPQLLHYEDRNSMTFSIESRVPFLTPALARFLFSLPEDFVIAADGTSKAVFRRAMRGIVPDAILDRRDKLGFPTPEQRWLTSSRTWVESILASEAAHQIPAVHIDAIRRGWEGIRSENGQYHSAVWRWINLILWSQKFNVSYT
jgi:asparagine synthase (glutamine-hydrolysing)